LKIQIAPQLHATEKKLQVIDFVLVDWNRKLDIHNPVWQKYNC